MYVSKCVCMYMYVCIIDGSVRVVANLCAWVLAGGVCCAEQVFCVCMYVHVCVHDDGNMTAVVYLCA